MQRLLVSAILFFVSASVQAGCDTINAKFEGESTRLVMATIAEAAGLRLANPEVLSGVLNAEFEDSDAFRLFPKLAWSMGYEVRIRGSEVWLEKRSGNLTESSI